MKLEMMKRRFLGDLFGNYNDIGKFARSFWTKLTELYENKSNIQGLTVYHLNMINKNPQKHVMDSKKAVVDLSEMFEHKRQIVLHAKRDFPISYSRGIKLAKMFHDRIEEIVQEWVGDKDLEKSRWIEESVRRFKIISEDTPFVSAKVTVPFYVMLSGILLPAYQSLPKMVNEGSMRTTPELAGVLGFLSYFESASDLRQMEFSAE